MRKYQKGPHPFVLEPPQSKRKVYSEGENLHFHMILLGRAVEYLPLIIRSFLLLGNYGIGQKNGKYRLEIVRTGKEKIYQAGQENINKFSTEKLCITPNGIDVKSASQSEIDINFITQTHIIYREKSSDHPEFHMVIRNLLRRISLISYFHCGGLRLPWDFKIIIKEAEKIKIKSSNLIWKNTERYSYRQQKEIPISGVTGAVKYQGNIPPFLSLLKAGELLHIGKGTSMGLGKIKIKVLN
ncbi:MAG: CRISPR system precrRNA processing endoribonuclease RAMP protein Cas6 [Candidatus Aminicenantes bacterium]|nr:CRISPR system precrRNA processing endoribonuclease RAMP protein Cas6 [Candidatus Aminicenantes bacterium]